MDPLQTLKADLTACPPHIKDSYGLIRCAEVDGRRFSAKSARWPTADYGFPVRLANEAIYYSLAGHNGLPMPDSAILGIGGEKYWGSEYLPDRMSLSANQNELSPERVHRVDETFKTFPDELAVYLKSVFLDVALFNSDRAPWNLLASETDGQFHLWYFDHDRSLGWKGDFGNAVANKIRSPQDEYGRLATYLTLESKYHWARRFSDRDQRSAIFASLALEPKLLKQIHPQIPAEWISAADFEEMSVALVAWWEHLRTQPYADLDQALFG